MKIRLRGFLFVLIPALLGSILVATAQEKSPAETAYADMEATLGFVPTFMKAFPEGGILPAWEEMKAVQMNPNTALSGKVKELIGLAVAAQIPCDYCTYFHTAAAKANGATDQEIKEAIAMAAITRHWSTVLNGSQMDAKMFREEADRIMAHAKEMSEGSK